MRRTLEHWKSDVNLVGVREEAGLAKLPGEERRAWLSLWKDVDTLLDETSRR